MTEKELNDQLIQIVEDESAKKHFSFKTQRRLRRINRVRKNEALFKVINTGGYAPHRGYVSWDFTGDRLLHSGEHIHYPKNSIPKKWIKRETGKRIRNCKDVPPKGNYYRRLFDYWWTLY